MAVQSGYVIQEKVARLLSKQLGKPVLKPNKHLALKDEVANRKPKKEGKERVCYLLELSVNDEFNLSSTNVQMLQSSFVLLY